MYTFEKFEFINSFGCLKCSICVSSSEVLQLEGCSIQLPECILFTLVCFMYCGVYYLMYVHASSAT